MSPRARGRVVGVRLVRSCRRRLWCSRECGGLPHGGEVGTGYSPARVEVEQDVGGSEVGLDRVSLVVGLLVLGADHDGCVVVAAPGFRLPGEDLGGEGAAAMAVQPLGLVQDEAERADEGHVVGGERVECGHVSGQLGVGQALENRVDLGIAHGCLSCRAGWVVVVLRNGGVPARRPPSMVTVVPVMKAQSGEASQTAAAATSSTVPSRPSGTAAMVAACAWGPAAASCSVRTGPGAMALTRTPAAA